MTPPAREAPEKAAIFAYLPPAAAEPGLWWRSTQVTVDEVGYHDGLFLEDTEGGRDLYLPLPTGVTPQRAEAQLELRFGESLIGESTIRISINDSVRRTVRRSEAGPGGVLQVNLPLSKSDVSRAYLKVHFDYTQLMDRDVCFSRNVTGAYTRIAPTSGLVINAGDTPPVTVQGAWSLLPGEVVISADFAHVTPSDLQVLLELATLLEREGHGYTFEHIPESASLENVHGQIVLTGADRLKKWGLSHGNEPAGAANLRLIATDPGKSPNGHRRVFLMIDRARALPAADLLRMPWRKGAGAHLINVTKAGEWPPPPESPDHVRLKDLGFMDSERRFSAVTEWKFPLPYGPMGDGMRPDQIQLTVFAPTTSEERAPVLLAAYLKEHLVYSGKLKSNGEVQTLSFVVPPQLLRASNRLNVVAQREEVASNCRVVVAAQPISLSPSSPVLLKPITETPSTFADLVPYQRSIHVYVSADALTAAAQLIPFLVATGEYFWPDVPPPALTFFDPAKPLKPEGMFVVVGDPKWNPEDAPVEFVNGRVRISSTATGKPAAMLDMSSDADWSVLQIARVAGFAGAWLRTSSGYGNLPDQHLFFEDENVALLDRRGVQMALRVGPSKDYQVEYPEAVSWFDSHRRLRIVLFVLAWLAAAMAVIYGLRRARRPASGNDDHED